MKLDHTQLVFSKTLTVALLVALIAGCRFIKADVCRRYAPRARPYHKEFLELLRVFMDT
jgi:hypothetical protein